MKTKNHPVCSLSSRLHPGKCALALTLGSVLAAASGAAMAAGPSTPVTTVATGLNNPRGLAFGPDGTLYVAEAGLGQGDAQGGSALGIGFTGAITEIRRLNSRHPSQRELVTGLASVGTPGHPAGIEVVGPDGLSFSSQEGLFAIMAESVSGVLADNPTANPDLVGQFGHLLKISAAGWERNESRWERSEPAPVNPDWTAVADVGDFDFGWTGAHQSDPWAPLNPPTNPPQPGTPQFPDANPYGVLVSHGHRWVVDAGANTVDEVRPDGTVRLVAYIPDPVVGGHRIADSVPTCIAERDGLLYVGTLAFGANAAGGPGQSKVYRIDPSSSKFFLDDTDVWANNLNPITGCGFGKDGSFYVTEFSTHFPVTDLGDVIKITVNHDGTAGTRTALGTGALHSPNGFACGPDGSIYVSNYSTSTAAGATPGQVVRVNN